MTLRAGVDVPTPPQNRGCRGPTHGTASSASRWPACCGWLALTVAFGLGAILWYRTTVEPSPGFPLQYAPPPGLGPVQTEYIRTESVPKNGLTATLFYLAERGLIDMRQVSDEQWNLRGKADKGAWADVDPVSVAVGSALKVMGPGTEFEAKHTVTAGKKLSKAKTDMAEAVEKWAFDNGLMVKRTKELWVRAANAIAFLLMLFGFFRWGFPATMWALPFAAFFLFSAASWKDGVGSRRTDSGRELWSRAGGFHRMLTTDSAETRFDFGARKDLYMAYVPFAVAAGAAALWAKKYQTTTGTAAPQPDWYNSSSTPAQALSVEAPVGRTSTASSRRCRRRSAPTPHRSPRRPAAAVAVAAAAAAVAAAAAEEEADHGEASAHRRAGARAAGAGRSS